MNFLHRRQAPENFGSKKPAVGQGWFQGIPIMGPPYGKLPILFPYHSHIFRDSYGSGMGMVWVRDPWGSLKIPWSWSFPRICFGGTNRDRWLNSRCCFQTCVFSSPYTWGNDLIRLIFFKWVGLTTNLYFLIPKKRRCLWHTLPENVRLQPKKEMGYLKRNLWFAGGSFSGARDYPPWN